jgi:hypothetical protein
VGGEREKKRQTDDGDGLENATGSEEKGGESLKEKEK